MKPYAKKFYLSKAWKQCRNSYYNYRHGLCERCSKPGDIVHHKKYITPTNVNNTNITLSFDNLELLCIDCHNKEHSKHDAIQYGLSFDNEGNLIQSPRGVKNK